MVRQIRTLTRDMLVSIVIILIMTAGMLTMWIYNGISIPLKKLKEATQNIKEGNLDFVLDAAAKSTLEKDVQKLVKKSKAKKEKTQKKKLKKLFQYVEKNYGYARAIGFKNSRGWEKTFTAEMIKNKKGSCYHFVALTWCITLFDVIIQTGAFFSDILRQSAITGTDFVDLTDQLDRIFDCPGTGVRSVIFIFILFHAP